MRIKYLASLAIVSILCVPAMAQRAKLEGDKYKIGIGGSTLGSNNGFRDAIISDTSLDPTIRISFNTMSKEKAQELRVGYDRYSSGSSDTLGIADVQYLWKFGPRQEAYYGVGLGFSLGASGGNFSVGTSTLGINLGKRVFLEARSVSDGTDYITTGFVGVRF